MSIDGNSSGVLIEPERQRSEVELTKQTQVESSGGGDQEAPDATAIAYENVRTRILSGDFEPESILNQVHIARDLDISRGPLREALRLLEGEGLVVSEQNRRSRVAALTAPDAEQIYALRVVNERLAVEISVPYLEDADFDRMEACLETMIDAASDADGHRWSSAHTDFHSIAMSHAHGRLRRVVWELREHAGRYVDTYFATDVAARRHAHDEHREFFEACSRRDAQAASEALGLHLAHNALNLLMLIDPLFEPTTLRTSLRQALGGY